MASLFGNEILRAIIGGSLIGLAASFIFVFTGRITGLSGIIYESVVVIKGENHWRWSFLSGLLGGGILLRLFSPHVLVSTLQTPAPILVIAGLLVGFGTRLGGGCTSGHGVCGVARLSKKSIVATAVFLITGMLVATLVKKAGFL